MRTREQEWLWGWDDTPGIVSVWADLSGRAWVWRRTPELVCEQVRFRPWVVLSSIEGLREVPGLGFRELDGDGLRHLVSADDGVMLQRVVLQAASRRLGRSVGNLRELDAIFLPPEEQYLVASGRTYFRGLAFDDLRRLSFDLETTGLDPERDRIFLIALRAPDGTVELIEGDEPDILRRFCERVLALDPDVIENHNLHGFDMPFVVRRAELAKLTLQLGRLDQSGVKQRAAQRGARTDESLRRVRYSLIGRELLDSMDAVRRYDFAARDLPGHGLKVVARHFGLAIEDRELVPGAQIWPTYQRDPERVRRYAREDVREASELGRLLGGASFALAGMAPRRYERLADAGPATGVIDPLLVRAYLRSGHALPVHRAGDGTQHSGAALYLFATGVAERVVKADVASLYPSLMRQYQIGPARDRLGVLLALVDGLVTQRLAAKAAGRAAVPGSNERYTNEAVAAAMKILVNSAYGYLGASGLTRFSDVHAANEVTRHGRELLALLCRELAARGVTLLEADTDGVYFAVPAWFTEADERRVVDEVGALLPAKVKLEFDGRYAAMLSHEPKNYALLGYDGKLSLRGVAFHSSRSEPYGVRFLKEALARLLRGDVAGVREVYLRTVDALTRRELPTRDLSSRVRLTKSPEEYLATRAERREHAYEALLGAGVDDWSAGERAHAYRGVGKRAALLPDGAWDDEARSQALPRDYDVDYYLRLLRDTFASRLERALTPALYDAVFADPAQLTLFAPSLAGARPILTVLPTG
ncbi:MAG TPA: 3'-5' exonuclease [Polyangiales bacterium]|nr:3'-5' exonuclease [Polyangiales bacterium]